MFSPIKFGTECINEDVFQLHAPANCDSRFISSANACKIRPNQSHITDIYISWQEKIAVFVPRFWHVCQIGLQYFDQN